MKYEKSIAWQQCSTMIQVGDADFVTNKFLMSLRKDWWPLLLVWKESGLRVLFGIEDNF